MSLERELEEIAARLRTLAQAGADTVPMRSNEDFDPANDRFRAARIARAFYQMRRERENCFEGSLFGEPGWDMLLDLAIQALNRRKVSVTDLCEASCVSQATALRWIQMMVDQGLIQRQADPLDARRRFVSLTPAAEIALHRHLLRCAAMIEELAKPVSLLNQVIS